MGWARWAALLWLVVAGCSECGQQSEEAPALEPDTVARSVTGALEGVVKLAPGAQLPSFTIDEMERNVVDHAKRGELPEECTPPKDADRTPVKLSPQGHLSGVMLAASQFSQSAERLPVIHEATIEDCRLTPRMIVAQKGDVLRVTNKVKFPFMPGHGDAPKVETLMPGQVKDFPLDRPGVDPLSCGFVAPCGRTDVVVMMHGLHTVTDATGHFRLDNFPIDETVEINAWHPLFKEAKLSVRLGRDEVQQVELILEPL